MSDLLLVPEMGGADIVIEDGKPTTTNGVGNAIYLSLFTPAWWGNGLSESSGRYNSRLPELFARPLNVSTRRDVEVAAQSALAWMVADGVAERIEAEVQIVNRARLDLRVTVYEPGGQREDFAYAVNWDTEEAALR